MFCIRGFVTSLSWYTYKGKYGTLGLILRCLTFHVHIPLNVGRPAHRGWGWAPTTIKVMLYKTNFRPDSKPSLDVLDKISFQKDTAESPGQPVAHREKLRTSVFASLQGTWR